MSTTETGYAAGVKSLGIKATSNGVVDSGKVGFGKPEAGCSFILKHSSCVYSILKDSG